MAVRRTAYSDDVGFGMQLTLVDTCASEGLWCGGARPLQGLPLAGCAVLFSFIAGTKLDRTSFNPKGSVSEVSQRRTVVRRARYILLQYPSFC